MRHETIKAGSITWRRAAASASNNMRTADKDYYLDKSGELTDDAEKAAFLLIRKGMEIPPDVREKFGIGNEIEEAIEPIADLETTGGEAKESSKPKPSANKARKPKETK